MALTDKLVCCNIDSQPVLHQKRVCILALVLIVWCTVMVMVML